MTTFFSVDVETTATNVSDGWLLTVGIQPVVWREPGQRPYLAPFQHYVRIDRSDVLADWESNKEQPSSSWNFWQDQDDYVRGEAYADDALLRLDPTSAALMIRAFVLSAEGDPNQRIFVANPVAFDKAWIDDLFGETGVENPFHYRSLCLRSMKFGLRSMSKWGSDRENHTPDHPHHALSDAIAQAHDLVAMLDERDAS